MTRSLTALAVLVVAALVLLSASLFTVGQTEQVLITQFGEPIRVDSAPGLHAKIPFIQTVISFDHRLLDYSTPSEEVILSDQRRLIVDSFTRFHITNPLQYYQAVGAQEDAIRARLNSVVTVRAAARAGQRDAAVRAVVGPGPDHDPDQDAGERRDEEFRRRDRGCADPACRPA